MLKRLALVSISIVTLSYLLVGCAGVRPQVDFYVLPAAMDEKMRFDAEMGSLTAESDGISVTVSALDAADLLEVTSDAYLNPYIHIGDWGLARPRYTVFDVTVRNDGESDFIFNPQMAILMGEDGKQYDAITYEELREQYRAYPVLEREIVYYPPRMYYRPPYYGRRWTPNHWYYHYDVYREYPRYVRQVYDASYPRRAVLKGTMLGSVKLYPGGKRQGFLVFPLVAPDSSRLKLILPKATDDGEARLEFHFERVPVVKDQQ